MAGHEVLARLSLASQRPQRRPDVRAALPAPAELWWTTPELVSLHGTALWPALDQAARQRLSFWEAVAFFSLNVHNERRLVAGARLRRARGGDPALLAYLDHFIREEEEHTEVFAAFCQRHAGGVLIDRNLALTDDADDFGFFARVLLFEGVVDHYNRAQARDERLPEVIRAIHRYHHRDEARHLLFGRTVVQQLWQQRAAEADAAAVGRSLGDYLASVGRELVSVDAYRQAGLADPHEARRLALASSAHQQRLAEAAAGPRAFFAGLGLDLGRAGAPAMKMKARERVRAFIAEARACAPAAIGDHTPLVESGLLTSLMIADLLLLLEELRGGALDLTALEPGAFRDLDTIVTRFLPGASS